eukprot:jgi/Astpho2/9640/e_gw1.00146.47.1_t
MNVQQLLHRLNALVTDCIGKHLYASAVFYADKLMTLADNHPDTVHQLASALFLGRQYRRVLLLLNNMGMVESSPKFRYLAARCLAECKDWEECLAMIGPWEDEACLQELQAQSAGTVDMHGQAVSYPAALALLRGQAYDALENHGRAIRWYRQALKFDPFCYEAFQVLVDNHMLTSEEVMQLQDELQLKPEDDWLRLLYRQLQGDSPVQGAQDTPMDLATPGPQDGSQLQPVLGPGCGLAGNLHVLLCKAEWLYNVYAFQECFALTSQLLSRDAYALEVFPVHIAACVELQKKNELFLRGHRLVQEYPERALSWFAVGCYYLCTQQFESARMYFGKATTLESSFAPAWIGFGNAFAAQDESDQAMAAYRTAARLFPGLHLPLVGMGMEYQRMNNLHLAEQLFEQAHKMSPCEPLACNELGVLASRKGQHANATHWFLRALDLVPGKLTAAWEPTLINLGHMYRKQWQWSNAIATYERALGLKPGQAGTYAALGFTHHLMGESEQAVEHYHTALGIRPDDTFISEMLTILLQQEAFTDVLTQPDDLWLP